MRHLNVKRPSSVCPSEDEATRSSWVVIIIFYDFGILGKQSLFYLVKENLSFLGLLDCVPGKRVVALDDA